MAQLLVHPLPASPCWVIILFSTHQRCRAPRPRSRNAAAWAVFPLAHPTPEHHSNILDLLVPSARHLFLQTILPSSMSPNNFPTSLRPLTHICSNVQLLFYILARYNLSLLIQYPNAVDGPPYHV